MGLLRMDHLGILLLDPKVQQVQRMLRLVLYPMPEGFSSRGAVFH